MGGKKQTGFTIVELLIVIVVIGILAVITIVAYAGVQKRAEYATIANLADAGIKALEMYKHEYGSYPTTSFCFGVGYTDRLGSAEPDCYWDLDTGDTTSTNDVMNDRLAKIISTQPTVGAFTTRLYTRWNYQGAQYSYSTLLTLDGTPHRNWFVYYIPDSNGTCPTGDIVKYGYPDSTTDSSVKNSYAMTIGARCYVPLR